ncbi:MAG: 2-hydroxychromene-2-carboxylate isomerase [Pseudomonadota bacterium]
MTDTPKLEFFYDCSSPWTYFAFKRLQPIAFELDVDVHWRPILVGGVFNAVNQAVYSRREGMFRGDDTRQLRYYLKDLQDWAALCDITIVTPERHPISSVKAMRGAFFAEEQNALLPYSTAVFEAYWGGQRPDIDQDDVLTNICERVGLDSQAFHTAITAQSYKDLLRANTDELIERGGYGSPTLFINGDDMFFGNDRLPLVERRLQSLRDVAV